MEETERPKTAAEQRQAALDQRAAMLLARKKAAMGGLVTAESATSRLGGVPLGARVAGRPGSAAGARTLPAAPGGSASSAAAAAVVPVSTLDDENTDDFGGVVAASTVGRRPSTSGPRFFDGGQEVPEAGSPTPSTTAAAEDPQHSKLRKMLEEVGLEETFTPSTTTRFEAVPASPGAAFAAADAAGAAGAASPRKGPPANVDPRDYMALAAADPRHFASQPAPEGVTVLCQIVRHDKGMYPTYELRVERGEKEQKANPGAAATAFLLAGRKRKKSTTSNYLISLDLHDLARDSDKFVAKLRGNFTGTTFTVYDDGVSAGKLDDDDDAGAGTHQRQELAVIMYETNLLGLKGPRKMTVVLPAVDDRGQRVPIVPSSSRECIAERFKRGELAELLPLVNKQPEWNDETQSYVLNFHGRVTQASVKNFQIIHEGDPAYVIMQFGRVSDTTFTMDYQYPMSALQAFAIALSSFDGKLLCE